MLNILEERRRQLDRSGSRESRMEAVGSQNLYNNYILLMNNFYFTLLLEV